MQLSASRPSQRARRALLAATTLALAGCPTFPESLLADGRAQPDAVAQDGFALDAPDALGALDAAADGDATTGADARVDVGTALDVRGDVGTDAGGGDTGRACAPLASVAGSVPALPACDPAMRTVLTPAMATLRAPLACATPDRPAAATFVLEVGGATSTQVALYIDLFGSAVNTAMVLARGPCALTTPESAMDVGPCTDNPADARTPQYVGIVPAGTYTLAVFSHGGTTGEAVVHARAVPLRNSTGNPPQVIARGAMRIDGTTLLPGTTNCPFGSGAYTPPCSTGAPAANELVYVGAVCPPAAGLPGREVVVDLCGSTGSAFSPSVTLYQDLTPAGVLDCAVPRSGCVGATARASVAQGDMVLAVVDDSAMSLLTRCGRFDGVLTGF